MTTILTDDEIVALMVDRQLAWPTLLPTVDSLDASELGAATFRGQRSFFVRELDADQVGDIAAKYAQGHVLAAAYHQDAMGDLLIGSSAVYVFMVAAGLAIDVVSPLGVHFLDDIDESDALERVGSVLGDVALMDTDYPADASLAVYVTTDRTTALFSVRSDSVRRRPVDEVETSPSTQEDLRAVLASALSGQSL